MIKQKLFLTNKYTCQTIKIPTHPKSSVKNHRHDRPRVQVAGRFERLHSKENVRGFIRVAAAR